MIISMDNENITGADLQMLLDFCFRYSDRVDMTTQLHHKLSEDELEEIKKKAIESAYVQNRKYKQDYEENKNGYRDSLHFLYKGLVGDTKEDAFRYFDGLLDQELEITSHMEEYYTRCLVNEEPEIDLSSYDFGDLPFVSVVRTNETAVTRGPIVDLCTFLLNGRMRQEFLRIEALFAPINIAGVHFDDMTFYSGDRHLLAVCSHEQYATFDLEEEECKEFIKLGLPHDIPSEHWWETEYMEHYAREDGGVPLIIEPAILGGAGGSTNIPFADPAEIQRLQEDYAKQLKPNLRSVTELLAIIKHKYPCEEDLSQEAQDLVRGNVLFNAYFAKKLPESHETKAVMLQLKKEDSALPLYENQEREYQEYWKKTKESFPLFKVEPYQEGPIFVGAELNSGYFFVEGSKKLLEEATVLRGLDKEELKKPFVVLNYINSLTIYNVLNE
jgi:hypothetical protein